MKKLRILLLPFAIMAECFALFFACTLMIFSRDAAEDFALWTMRILPKLDWYIGKDSFLK